MAKSLGSKSDDIQKCAIENVPDMDKLQILAKVAIDNTGKAIDLHVTVTGNSATLAEVKSCVESVIRGIKFPAGSAPVTFIERSWTIAGTE